VIRTARFRTVKLHGHLINEEEFRSFLAG